MCMGQVPSIASPSHQPPSVPSDQRQGVLIMCEECDATCDATYAAETWAMKADTLNRLRHNDRAMIRWICNVKAKDEVSSDSLLTKLGI